MNINLNVNGQSIKADSIQTVNGTVNVVECSFTFDEYWDSYPARKAIFRNSSDFSAYEASIIGGSCIVPHEVLAKSGDLMVAVCGENTDGQIDRTNTTVVAFVKRTLQGGANSIDPTPDQYAQYVAEVSAAIREKAAEVLPGEVETYVEAHKEELKGPPGAPGAPGQPGEPGYTPIKGVDYFDGAPGAPGYTPVKGVDYFDGKDYQITSSDYEAIAERTKELVPPYDDSQIKREIIKVNDSITELSSDAEATRNSLDALWKMNKGQTYDVIESTSEDYSKQIPSGSKYASVDMIGGKSVVWNQLCKNLTVTQTKNGVSFTNNGNGSWTLNGTSSAKAEVEISDGGYNTNLVNGHKYLLSGCPKGGAYATYHVGLWQTGSTSLAKDYGNGVIATATLTTALGGVWVTVMNANVVLNDLVFKPRLYDLTQIFGAGNEPTSVDDPRIAWIEAYASEHPEFNSGEIISSKVDAIELGGRNLLDFTKYNLFVDGGARLSLLDNGYRLTCLYDANWMYSTIGLFDATPYIGKKLSFTCKVKASGNNISSIGVSIRDANGTKKADLVSTQSNKSSVSASFTVPQCEQGDTIGLILYGNATNDVTLITGLYVDYTDIQIEISNSPTEYIPHHEPTVIQTNFPILRSTNDVYDYIDVENGELHRRIGVADLGSLNWKYFQNNTFYVDSFRGGKALYGEMLCSKYLKVIDSTAVASLPDKSIKGLPTSDAVIYVRDSAYSDAPTFKSAMNGVPLYYELATETIEPIDTSMLNEWLEVEANGSITFVNDGKLLVPNTEKFVRKLNEV